MMSPKNQLNTQSHNASIESQLKNAPDAIIVFNLQGNIIAINEKAAALFGKSPNKLINQYFWQQLTLNSFSQKRQLIKARQSFLLAKEGIAQQFTWMETNSKKPILAYNIMINRAELHGTSILFAKITDVLPTKTTDWVLWSLAQIKNHHEITEVIDEILKLVSNVFSADYATVGLIDKENNTNLVSFYHFDEKLENVSYSLADSPCEQVQNSQSICFFEDIQKQFPKDHMLQTLEVNYYLGGPITNAEDEVIGIMNVLKKEPFEINEQNNTLFLLFIRRINLELERLLSQRKLQFMASIPSQDPNPVIRIAPSGDVLFSNAQGKILLNFWKNYHKGLPDILIKESQKTKTSNQVIRIELEADDKIYLFSLIWIPDFNQINIYGTDISQLKNTEQNMMNLARIDGLTQIANRQYFEETLLEKINKPFHKGEQLALLLIDLDDFKTVNDTLGHPVGDRLLKAATKRMVRCLRKDDFIARLGGDEFIVLLDKTNIETTIMVTEKMIRILSLPFQFGEYQMTITASIGVALYPEEGVHTGDLLKHSDIAMYHAKKTGKNSYTVFSKTLHSVQDKRNEVIRKELKFAASKNELYIDYQPQIDLTTNKIIGLEALLRWKHPTQGLILPLEFISEAEKTGCIHLISQWLIEQSLKDFALVRSINSTIELAINVSLSQINDSRFLESLCENLLKHKINKNKIILDVSERSISPHFEQISKSLRKIHRRGIKLCLDNFGSPKISLPKLLALPISYLKLDHILLYGIEKRNKHRMLLKGIITLAKDLHLKVIQKGIETEMQHRVVASLGCEYAQGFYYCPPLKSDELHDFIKNNLQPLKPI